MIETWESHIHPAPATGTLGTEVYEAESPECFLIYASIHRHDMRTFRAVQFRDSSNITEWTRIEPLL
jgi:hypothetical protein